MRSSSDMIFEGLIRECLRRLKAGTSSTKDVPEDHLCPLPVHEQETGMLQPMAVHGIFPILQDLLSTDLARWAALPVADAGLRHLKSSTLEWVSGLRLKS